MDGAEGSRWNLQHLRRVRWFPNTENEFPTRTLGGQVRTFAAVNVATVKKWVKTLTITDECRNRELADMPISGRELDPAELGRRLFVEGLPSEYIDKLLKTFSSLQRVASWYRNKEKRPKGRPSERETVCYLVVPFLLSLGWSQQTAAVEWNHIDVALFTGMPPADSTPARRFLV